MRESIRGADDEGVKGVAAVQAGATGSFRVGGLRTFGEVSRPVLVDAGERFAVFVNLVGVGERLVEHQGVLGFVGSQWSDTDAEFDLLAEPTAEGLGDLSAQVTFDLVLHEAARYRQQSKSFDNRQRLYEVQPSSLLRSQRRAVGLTVAGEAVAGELAVELGDDRIPDRRET